MTRRTFQKLLGLGLIATTILNIVILHDLTLAILTIPLGLYALFTKKDILVPIKENEKENFE